MITKIPRPEDGQSNFCLWEVILKTQGLCTYRNQNLDIEIDLGSREHAHETFKLALPLGASDRIAIKIYPMLCWSNILWRDNHLWGQGGFVHLVYLILGLLLLSLLLLLLWILSHIGTPGWLSRWSVWLRLRSRSHGSWDPAPRRALCRQLGTWRLLGILGLPLSLCPSPARALSLSVSQ